MKCLLIAAFLLITTPALAQQPSQYAAPDEELWNVMIQAFGNISMPLTAHQQIQQIIQTVQRQAMQRKEAAEAAAKATAKPVAPAK